MKHEIEYLPDSSVDERLDRELRALFTRCFTKPCDVVFREQRYFREPYAHRWVARGDHGAIIAHAGIHDKRVRTHAAAYRVGGVCEVCVHPDHRGQGLVRQILTVIHAWLAGQGYDFALLFGNPDIYRSSGYSRQDNLRLDAEGEGGEKTEQQAPAMVKPLTKKPWPAGDVHLIGPKF